MVSPEHADDYVRFSLAEKFGWTLDYIDNVLTEVDKRKALAYLTAFGKYLLEQHS